MKTSENNSLNLFKGAGLLLGFAMTIVTAIIVFVISHNFVVSISSSVPIGITTGIALEQKFQKGNTTISPKATKLMIGLLSVGVIVFVAIFFLVKLI